MRKVTFVLLFLFLSPTLHAQNDEWTMIRRSLPSGVWKGEHSIIDPERHEMTTCHNPFFQRGDFNGDGNIDLAVLIREISTDKMGILIIHFPSRDAFVIGAGVKYRGHDELPARDILPVVDIWRVEHRERIQELSFDNSSEPKIVYPSGEVLYFEKDTSAAGYIYWDGSAYRWIQTDD